MNSMQSQLANFLRMFRSRSLIIALAGLVVASSENVLRGQEEVPTEKEAHEVDGKELLKRFVGKWKGNCKTWFEPGKLADESEIEGQFEEVLAGRFVRHTYKSQMKGKPRQGEELLACNSVTKKFQTTWVDDFHMNYAILISEGPAIENGFSVKGEYDVAEGTPRWGWRTDYVIVDDDHLRITAYNVSPEGEEAKAVEIEYARIK